MVAKVGRELYEKFFRGYTRKQWQRDPSELHASVCARIPIRTNTDDRYFTDSFQNMPADGYTAMFERILDHPGIDVAARAPTTTTSRDEVEYDHLVYTGPIDRFFDYRFGALPYRVAGVRAAQRADARRRAAAARRPSMNEPGEDVPYTRGHEFRHLTGQDARLARPSRSSTRARRATRTTRSRNDETRALYKQLRGARAPS